MPDTTTSSLYLTATIPDGTPVHGHLGDVEIPVRGGHVHEDDIAQALGDALTDAGRYLLDLRPAPRCAPGEG